MIRSAMASDDLPEMPSLACGTFRKRGTDFIARIESKLLKNRNKLSEDDASFINCDDRYQYILN